MSDVFISYSRKDSTFVRQVFDALQSQKREVWVDWQGINYSTKWWEEICAGIEGADNFVLILSAESLQSPYCHREIEHALKHSKRIIPVEYQDIDTNGDLFAAWQSNPTLSEYQVLARHNWEMLRAIQWISVPQLADLGTVVTGLLNTVDTDPQRAQTHTRLLLRRRDWESRGRSPSALLRGDELAAYEAWRDESVRAGDPPQPTIEQTEYIHESRRAEDAAIAEEKRQIETINTATTEAQTARLAAEDAAAYTKRLRRNTWFAFIFTVIGFAGLGVFAFYAVRFLGVTQSELNNVGKTLTPIPQTLVAISATISAGERQIDSLNMANAATSVLNDVTADPQTAALLAIRGLRKAYTAQTDAVLVRALNTMAQQQRFVTNSRRMYTARFSPDGKQAVFAYGYDYDGVAEVWDISTHKLVQQFKPAGGIADAQFTPDGSALVMTTSDHQVIVQPLQPAGGATGPIREAISIGEAGFANRLEIAPNGQFFVAIDHEGKGHARRLPDGAALYSFEAPELVTGLAIAPDSTEIVTLSVGGFVRRLDARTGTARKSVLTGFESALTSIVYAPDGQTVVIFGDKSRAEVWDAELNRLQFAFHSEGVPFEIRFSNDGTQLLSASSDGLARLWNASTGAMIRGFVHSVYVDQAVFSPDNTLIATQTRADGVTVWDAQTGRRLRTIPTSDPLWAFAPDGGSLLIGGTLYQLALNADGRTYQSKDGLHGSTFSADGATIYGVEAAEPHSTVQVWSFTANKVTRIPISDIRSFASAFTTDGRRLVTIGGDARTQLFDLPSGREIGTFAPLPNVTTVRFAPDAKTLFTVSGMYGTPNTVEAWNAETGERRYTLGLEGDGRVFGIAPDSSLISTYGNGKVALWEAATGKPRRTFDYPNQVGLITFSPDSKQVLVVGEDTPVAGQPTPVDLWDIGSGAKVYAFPYEAEVLSVAFSPTNDRLVIGDKTGALRVWERSTGAEKTERGIKLPFGVTSVEYSAKGRFLVAVAEDGTIRLWEAESGQLVRSFTHSTLTSRAFFSPDEKFVLSSDGLTLRLWDTDNGALIAYACGQTTRPFSDFERTRYAIPMSENACP